MYIMYVFISLYTSLQLLLTVSSGLGTCPPSPLHPPHCDKQVSPPWGRESLLIECFEHLSTTRLTTDSSLVPIFKLRVNPKTA